MALQESFRIEAGKDALDMVTMMEIIHGLTKLCQGIDDSLDREKNFKTTLTIAESACENVRHKLRADGNTAAFLKFVAELAVYANELTKAKSLLEEARPLFEAEKTIDCSGLVVQCKEIIAIIDRKLVGQ